MQNPHHHTLSNLKIFAVFAIVFAILFYVSWFSNRVEIKRFDATPMECKELQLNLSIIPEEKLHTIYTWEIIIHNGTYSAEKHKAKFPRDVAVGTKRSDDGNVVTVILTNKNAKKLVLK